MNRQEYFEKALIAKSEYEDKHKVADLNLKNFLSQFEKGQMGLTPDHVKEMPEFKKLKQDYNNAANDLRNFNQNYNKTFKAEIKKEREEKRKSLVQCGSCHGTNPMNCKPDCF